jgi:hypothetical protein
MLSSIHPLGEAGRGQRWWLTVTAHVIGALGGLAGAAVAALGPPSWATGAAWLAALAVLVTAVGAAVVDWSGWPPWLWRPRRQVNEDWLTRYRGWVYGGGFGVQLGAGVATIVTAAALYLAAVLAVVSASVAGGALIGLSFGLVRGAATVTGRRIVDPAALVRFHRRLQERARWGRTVAVTADAAAGVGALGWLVARAVQAA